jgi:seryl-tRNA synthetase
MERLMLDIKFVRENLEFVRERLASRGLALDTAALAALEQRRRDILAKTEELRALRNKVSAQIPALKKQGQDAAAEMARMKAVGEEVKTLEQELAGVEKALDEYLLGLPNLPDDSVPEGTTAQDNREIRSWGQPRPMDFPPLDHVDLGTRLGILDLDRAAKITGARFAVYRGVGAALERALVAFMLDVHTREHGYSEVLPPFMVNAESLVGTGNLPKFAADLFHLEGWPFYLIPTAEVPVTNLYRDEILEEAALPIRHAAYTPCFRSEAGSYGKDTRGLIRQHQFQKVELVAFTRPEDSMAELERLTGNAERILELLGLPYRRMLLCTGDMGFSSAKTYDLEVWLPSQKKYVEISSCSNFKDFQARRAGLRYRPEGGKPRLLHTLNGSGLAIGRTWVAILENYQNADGSVTVPEVLRPYLHGLETIRRQD